MSLEQDLVHLHKEAGKQSNIIVILHYCCFDLLPMHIELPYHHMLNSLTWTDSTLFAQPLKLLIVNYKWLVLCKKSK